MQNVTPMKFNIQLSFEEIGLPPFHDILLLGKKCPQGLFGVSHSMNLLIPDEFEVYEISNLNVEAVFIHKRILKKMEKDKIISILEEKVFPYITEEEIVKVDFKVKVFYDNIEGKL